jgi:hypothetical protein
MLTTAISRAKSLGIQYHAILISTLSGFDRIGMINSMKRKVMTEAKIPLPIRRTRKRRGVSRRNGATRYYERALITLRIYHVTQVRMASSLTPTPCLGFVCRDAPRHTNSPFLTWLVSCAVRTRPLYFRNSTW